MATTIPTSLTVVNETDVRGQALLALILQYATIQGYYGFRSFGANTGPSGSSVSFPCVMIDPVKQDLKMARLGKYILKITYMIYFFCQESSPDAIVTQATGIAEIFAKLFSNNALGDGTPRFKQYPNPGGGYYWLNSEMSVIDWSTSFLNSTPDNLQTYMRAGRVQFEIEDVILK